MKQVSQAPEDVLRYFQQAATLRLSLQYNWEDYQFSEAGGRIVYIMDANVVQFFIDPEAESRHVTIFGGARTAHYAAGTALITAEFLFSRELAGQGDSPALIMPGHANEVLSIVDRIRKERDSSNPQHSTQLSAAKLDQLRVLVESVSSGSHTDRSAAIDELRRIVPEVAEDLLKGPFLKVKQLQRLYDEDLLRPLALHTAATREILRPAHRDVAYWETLIRAERHQQPRHRIGQVHERRGHTLVDTERVRRDAEALVQTILLDDAVSDKHRTAYVMVTADHRVFDAYAKWYWADESNRKCRRFVLRTPLQYAPILNVMQMPNDIYTPEVFNNVCDALDALFSRVLRSESDYPHKLAVYRALAGSERLHSVLTAIFRSNPLSFDQGAIAKFQRIRDQWHQSFGNGVLLNAELMQQRLRADFVPLAKLLHENADLKRALHEDQKRSLERIESTHLLFNTMLNLSLMAHHPNRAGAETQRAPFLIRAKFPNLIKDESAKAALERLASSPHDLVKTIYRTSESAQDYQSYFFAACLAFRCEDWRAALHYASRSLEFAPNDEAHRTEQNEIEFLVALATRYGWASGLLRDFTGSQAISRAFNLLKGSANFCQERQDIFGLARALVEQNSLMLVVVYRAALSAPSSAPVLSVPTETFRMIAEEATLQIEKDLYKASDDLVYPEALETLRFQAAANVVSARVFASHLALDEVIARDLEPSKDQLERAIDELEPRLQEGWVPPILAVEHLMARWIIGRISRSRAARELERLIPAGTEEKLPLTLDRVEVSNFRKRLALKTRRDVALGS